MLSVAWGPLIQLLPLSSKAPPMHYIIAPSTEFKQSAQGVQVDPCLKSAHFLALNLLVATLSTQDIRVLFCKQFKQGVYQSPLPEQVYSDF